MWTQKGTTLMCDDGNSTADVDADLGINVDGLEVSSQHSHQWSGDQEQLREEGELAELVQQLQPSSDQPLYPSYLRQNKRKGPVSEDERRLRRRLANRESARRMRAKRNQEARQLETAVNQLKDKNKQLERENKAYAKSMQQLQAEMLTLKTQLQHNMAAAQQQVQQQETSSELHQVLSSATAVPSHQQQMFQAVAEQQLALHAAGLLPFSDPCGSFSAGQPPALIGQQQHSFLAAAATSAAAGYTTNATLTDLQQQLGSLSSSWSAVNSTPSHLLLAQLHQLHESQQQLARLGQSGVPKACTALSAPQQLSDASAGAPGSFGVGNGLPQHTNDRQQQHFKAEPVILDVDNDDIFGGIQHHVFQQDVATQLPTSDPITGSNEPLLTAATAGFAMCGAPTSAGDLSSTPLLFVDVVDNHLPAGPETALQASNASAALAGLMEVTTAQRQMQGTDDTCTQQQAQDKQACRPSGFRPWAPQLHLLPQSDVQQQQQQQQQQPHTAAGMLTWTNRGAMQQHGFGASPCGSGDLTAPPAASQVHLPALLMPAEHSLQVDLPQQHVCKPMSEVPAKQQALGLTGKQEPVAAGDDGGARASAGAESTADAATAAAAAAMLAARGRAFAKGYANPTNLCGFDIPDPFPAIVPAPAAALPSPAAAAAPAAYPLAAASHTAIPPVGYMDAAGMKGLSRQLRGPLPLGETPTASAPAAAAAAAHLGSPLQLMQPCSAMETAEGDAAWSYGTRAQQGLTTDSGQQLQHSSHAPAGRQLQEPSVDLKKKRFPLKRPSKFAAQQTTVIAAAAAAAGLSEAGAASACQGSCGSLWLPSGAAMQWQLGEQQRKHRRKHMQHPAAAVGDTAVRIISASSRVGEGSCAAAAAARSRVESLSLAEVSQPAIPSSAEGAAVGGSGDGSPTSRRTGGPTRLEHRAGHGGVPPVGALGPAAVSLQRTASCVEQQRTALSVPWGFGMTAAPHDGLELSETAVDGCRSYASEPAAHAAAGGLIAGAALGMSDIAQEADHWDLLLLQLQQQQEAAQVQGHMAAAALAAHERQQQQQQVMITQAGAGAAATAAAVARPQPSPQLHRMQQHLQQLLQRNKDGRVRAEQHQQHSSKAQDVVQACSPNAADGEHNGDHAVPMVCIQGPFWDTMCCQQQQQQQHALQTCAAGVDEEVLTASCGPASAAAGDTSLTLALRSGARQWSDATSPGRVLGIAGTSNCAAAAAATPSAAAATVGDLGDVLYTAWFNPQPRVAEARQADATVARVDRQQVVESLSSPPELERLLAAVQHEGPPQLPQQTFVPAFRGVVSGRALDAVQPKGAAAQDTPVAGATRQAPACSGDVVQPAAADGSRPVLRNSGSITAVPCGDPLLAVRGRLCDEVTHTSTSLQGLWLDEAHTPRRTQLQQLAGVVGHPTGGVSCSVAPQRQRQASPPLLHAGSSSSWQGGRHGDVHCTGLVGTGLLTAANEAAGLRTVFEGTSCGVDDGSRGYLGGGISPVCRLGESSGAGDIGGLGHADQPAALMDSDGGAANRALWSCLQDEERQWFEDIFSSGPTLPLEPGLSRDSA